jgi:hypothetical protein
MTTKLAIIGIALGLATGSALAQNNNPCPGDKAYQVNIIGVPKGKNPTMDNNNGHRIFVPLNGPTNIYMSGDVDNNASDGLQCGNDFRVTDANGTDQNGARLLVPCDNTDITNVCYTVFATPLGTPGGRADVDVVCSFDSTVIGGNIDEGDCAQGEIDFSLVRNSGKPVQKDITKFMRASGCIDVGGETGVCDAGDTQFNNVWIFNLDQLQDYFWIYDNQGLRVAQLRFCDVSDIPGACGSVTTVQ